MTMIDNKCDVCHVNEPVGVAASPFAAMSMAYCIECLRKPAESEGIFVYLWEDVADFDLNNLHTAVFRYHTFKDGKYISFRDWAKKHGARKPTDG